MKKLYRNTKISFLLASLFFMGEAFSRTAPIAVVDSIQGNAFVITAGGTKKLKTGDHLSDFSEIRTEEGSQITFSDYYDHRYHLSGSGHVKLLNKIVELRQGYLWLQSYHSDHTPFMVQTANAVMTYTKGEAILSFDSYTGQSQLLVLKDNVEFANILERERKYKVLEGSFSYIHKDYEQGTPRRPTPIGYKSYEKVTSLFDNVTPMDKDNRYERHLAKKSKKVGRSIASISSSPQTMPAVPDDELSISNSGEILYVKKKEVPVLKAETALNYHQEKLKKMLKSKKKKKFAPEYSKKSGVTIKIFGQSHGVEPLSESVRRPASYHPQKKLQVVSKKKPVIRTLGARQPASVEPFSKPFKASVPKNDFESSLIDEYKKQMRHSTEVNNLIEDLQSYDQDYKKSY